MFIIVINRIWKEACDECLFPLTFYALQRMCFMVDFTVLLQIWIWKAERILKRKNNNIHTQQETNNKTFVDLVPPQIPFVLPNDTHTHTVIHFCFQCFFPVCARARVSIYYYILNICVIMSFRYSSIEKRKKVFKIPNTVWADWKITTTTTTTEKTSDWTLWWGWIDFELAESNQNNKQQTTQCKQCHNVGPLCTKFLYIPTFEKALCVRENRSVGVILRIFTFNPSLGSHVMHVCTHIVWAAVCFRKK